VVIRPAVSGSFGRVCFDCRESEKRGQVYFVMVSGGEGSMVYGKKKSREEENTLSVRRIGRGSTKESQMLKPSAEGGRAILEGPQPS